MDNDVKNKIVIYQSQDKDIKIDVNLDKETIWLDQASIALLFNVNRSSITRHLNNIFKTNELNQKVVCSKIEHTTQHGAMTDKLQIKATKVYNLDAIISVGYRINSSKATQFRIWATNVLRTYLVEGYAVNQKVLMENSAKWEALTIQMNNLREVLDTKNLTKSQSKSLIQVITDYTKALQLIDLVDRNDIPKLKKSNKEIISLEYQTILSEINTLRYTLNAGELFGKDIRGGLASIIRSIEQSIDNTPLYNSVELKAANLLYLIIKNHPFLDGNKRIGSFAFIRYLNINSLLYRENGSRRIEQDTLVAIALLIAQSDRRNKDLMIDLVVYLINLE